MQERKRASGFTLIVAFSTFGFRRDGTLAFCFPFHINFPAFPFPSRPFPLLLPFAGAPVTVRSFVASNFRFRIF